MIDVVPHPDLLGRLKGSDRGFEKGFSNQQICFEPVRVNPPQVDKSLLAPIFAAFVHGSIPRNLILENFPCELFTPGFR